MSQTVVIVIGMPGSGKTTLIENVLTKEYPNYRVFDNVFGGGQERIDAFNEAIEKGESCIVSDIQFTNTITLDRFVRKIYHKATIKKIYFENNPTQCTENAIRRGRNKPREFELINEYTKQYNPPLVIPVWRPE